MTKELISAGLFILLSAGAVFCLIALWRVPGRARRAAGLVSTGGIYLLFTYLISLWAAKGGWPEGMFTMMAVVFVMPAVMVADVVVLILTLFGGAGVRTWRKAALLLSFLILALLILAFAFNRQIRAAWYQRDLDDPDPNRRGYGLLMLGGTGLSSMVPIISDGLDDTDATVRKDAVLALGTIDDPAALPAVKKALGDEDPGVRAAAAITIVPLGRDRPEVRQDLIRMLSDPDPQVREAAVMGLDTIDPNWRTLHDVPDGIK
jgi:hypothetical protein